MDSKELQLYQEEQRKQLLDLNKSVGELIGLIREQVDQYVAPPTEVRVNTEKEINITNLTDVLEGLESLGAAITKSIKDNSHLPPQTISIANIADAKPETIKVTNLDDLKDYFKNLEEAISSNQPVVNVAKQDIVFPTAASQAIPVRLSDGKTFYNAIATAVSGGMSAFKNSSGQGVQAQLDEDGNVPTIASQVSYDVQLEDTGTYTYIGNAVPGSATSSAVWRVKRLVNASGSTTHADGVSTFTKVWDDRASYSY